MTKMIISSLEKNKLMGVEANTNKTEYVHPLVEHKAGHTHFLLAIYK